MSEHESDYDQWAWLYNKTLGPDYSDQKMAFLDTALLQHLSADARILDLCCGTGQMIAPLQSRGFKVTGLDLSHDMLRFAKSNAPDAEFQQGDARDFHFDRRFSGALCASASLNHMSGAADLRDVFASVNNALDTGGIFVFDINHPEQMEQHWCNQPAAGEIAENYAWLITPHYDAATASGAFRVDMYLRPETQKPPFSVRIIDRLMRSRFLWRLRLRRLAQFAASHPDWQHKGTDFYVHGHDLDMVEGLLNAAGFETRLQTLTGSAQITDRDAACFVCRKVTDVAMAKEAAE